MRALGASEVRVVPGGVAGRGDLRVEYLLNLESRIATRVLREIGFGAYRNEDEIYRLAHQQPWSRWFSAARTIRVYVTAIRAPLKSLEYITLKIKDAICDRFRAELGSRPTVDTRNPQVRVYVFLTARNATLYLDTSGEALYLRGHKAAKVEAPLKENLAAGILRLTGWQPGTPLLDPMCGSGTFLLEAAQIALDDAPGLSRDAGGFGFERLNDFQPELWRELRRAAAERRREAPPEGLQIFGSDLTADAVARARQNLAHAGLDDLVQLEVADVCVRAAPEPAGVLVANPPYGERLSERSELAAFYPRLGTALKRQFAGWDCWLLSADADLAKGMRLAPGKKFALYNGALACALSEFRMVAGSNRK